MRRIKAGVKLFEGNNQGEYFLGRPKQLTRISTSDEKALALELISGKSEEEILHIDGIDTKLLQRILDELEVAQLIDTEQNALKVSQRYISKVEQRVEKSKKGFVDAALLQLQKRAVPELNQCTWIDGARDGGIKTLTERQSALIEIAGQKGVASILY